MHARRSTVGAGVAALTFLTVATPIFGAEASSGRPGGSDSLVWSFTGPSKSQPVALRNRLKAAGGVVRAFYYFNGKRVWLERSPNELSVRYSKSASGPGVKALDRSLGSSARFSPASRLRGRELSRVSVTGSSAAAGDLLARLKARPEVDFAYPAWVDIKSGGRLLLTDEVIVRLKRGSPIAQAGKAFSSRGLSVARAISRVSGVYVLRLSDPKRSDPLAISRSLSQSGLVDWAEPDFVQELHKDYLPNDPLAPEQWYVQNSGQNGGTVGADARLAAAWDLEKGNRAIKIAIIDDGVQLSHPDLAPNIYTNPREIPGNGIDDDYNGYVDDVHGWNFVADNNNVSPVGTDESADNHGTAVAGVAAARGDNSLGISGACPNCTILPVKIATEDDWATNSSIASAIVYAGEMADVINISWGGSEASGAVQFALQYALTNGRDGKGAIILASAGNEGSGYLHYTLADLPPDTYRFRWVYSKDASDNFPVGADTAWLAWVRFPDGSLVNFEQAGSALPPGWSTGGDGGSSWSVVNDPVHSDEGRCWSHAAKAGTISNNQQTYIDVVANVKETGNLEFLAFRSSEESQIFGINGGTATWPLDGLRLWVDKGNDGTWEWSDSGDLYGGVPPTGLVYPAAFPQAVSVGASTNFDCRASYSQFGQSLDLAVPSSGGGLTDGVVTTDRTGSAGYSPGDYFSDFGGTSASAPLAAGVAGLILSRNPGLSATRVQGILENSADKVSPELAGYDPSGHSDRYGYGRIDALRALESTPLPSTIAFSRSRYSVAEGRAAPISIRRSGNTAAPASVKVDTFGRRAKAGRDFEVLSRRIRFAPGESVKTISVQTVDDKIHEPTERLNLRLSNTSSGAVVAEPSGSALAILDNDVRHGDIAAASMSQDVFVPEQAKSVKLAFRFDRPSGTFRYVLSRMENGAWWAVSSGRNIGDFSGAHTLTAKALFARRRIRAGRYRVQIFADTNSKRLVFMVSQPERL